MSAALAASPWYCTVLRGASEWLERAARRLEAHAIDRAAPPPGDAYESAWARAEERLREIRLRNLRYY